MSIKLFDLSGKSALVMGGSAGIGLAIVEGLGEMGAKIIITARKAGKLQEAAAGLRDQGIDVHAIVADMGPAASVTPLVDEILERFGTLDIFLASDASAFVTGQTIIVDGGISLG